MRSIKTLSHLRLNVRFPSSLVLIVALARLQPAMAAPAMSLDAQVARSAVIVAGTVTSVRQIGSIQVEVPGRSVPATLYEAEVRVGRTLKGTGFPSVLFVRFPIESNPAGGSGHYNGVAAPSYRMLFLRPVGSHFEFTEPQFPSLPAIPTPPVATSADVVSAVVQELTQVVESPKTTDMDKLEVIYRLESMSLPAATDVFRCQLTATNPVVRAAAVSALLQRNNLRALAVARELLMNPPANVPKYLVDNIASAIGRGIKDEKAIPILAVLLKAPDARTRRSAAYALRNTGSQEAIPALAVALDDPDQEVRYYAVIGLGEITGQSEWRPLWEDFQGNEVKYMRYWRDWVRAER